MDGNRNAPSVSFPAGKSDKRKGKPGLRVVLIHRYFWPDTSPYGILLRRIAEHLADEGLSVTVLTGQPTYSAEAASQSVPGREKVSDRLLIRRVRLFSQKRFRLVFRILNDLLFCVRILMHVVAHRPQMVMCSTQPPVIGAAIASLASRLIGAKFVYHLQDIHPEVVSETGHMRPSIATRVLKWLDRRTVRKAHRVVVLSDDMKNALVNRDDCSLNHIDIIPNFNLPRFEELASPPAEMLKSDGRFRLMFAGNVGRFQNLDTIVKACLQIPSDTSFEFVLMGDGKAKADLQSMAEQAGDDRIQFFPRQPLSIAEPLMQQSDLCVVSLQEDVYKFAFPSKLASYLSLDCPVLIVCEPESQLSRLATENGFGLASPQSSVSEIKRQIQWAIDHPEEIAAMRTKANEFFGQNYSTNRVLPKWTALINSFNLGNA